MINQIRRNIGAILSSVGLVLLAILTYGDIGELLTEQYWRNVGGNITSIGALSVGLVMVQYAIKQGVSEQALSNGLNTERTQLRYGEHSTLISESRSRIIYLPYFLSSRNERETKRKKLEFLLENDLKNEKMLYQSGNKKLIEKYRSIKINITLDSIQWSTTDIVYTKNGRIQKLGEYRKSRAVWGLVTSTVSMLGTALITGGLFLNSAEIPFWQKSIKFLTYIICMAVSAILSIIKNYEKGAFGVPNELEEINNIWREFQAWQVPSWVVEEVKRNASQNIYEEVENEQKTESSADSEAVLHEKQEESKNIQEACPSN